MAHQNRYFLSLNGSPQSCQPNIEAGLFDPWCSRVTNNFTNAKKHHGVDSPAVKAAGAVATGAECAYRELTFSNAGHAVIPLVQSSVV
jgi:hypothetical protein